MTSIACVQWAPICLRINLKKAKPPKPLIDGTIEITKIKPILNGRQTRWMWKITPWMNVQLGKQCLDWKLRKECKSVRQVVNTFGQCTRHPGFVTPECQKMLTKQGLEKSEKRKACCRSQGLHDYNAMVRCSVSRCRNWHKFAIPPAKLMFLNEWDPKFRGRRIRADGLKGHLKGGTCLKKVIKCSEIISEPECARDAIPFLFSQQGDTLVRDIAQRFRFVTGKELVEKYDRNLNRGTSTCVVEPS